MNLQDTSALEHWQTSIMGRTERRMKDLIDVVDDLTTLAHSREGVRMMRLSFMEMVEARRKLNDLILDFQPTQGVA